jgi:2-dehydro-3-deoxyphosphogluconate aldolase / (4S)-4-hydroxy-2-oxoglutarate aldolase
VKTSPEPSAFTALRTHRLVAAIRAATPEAAERAAKAIALGGIHHIEITFTIPDAVSVMRSLAGQTNMILGSGTTLTEPQARAALEAGAQFLIAPNFAPEVAAVAREAGVMYCPGAYTTGEILAAHAGGADLVKVYPVGVAGGPAYIRVIRDPLPNVPMLAAGGTNLENLVPFLEAGCMAIGLGAALCDPALVAAGKWDELTSRALSFVERLPQAQAAGTVPAGA